MLLMAPFVKIPRSPNPSGSLIPPPRRTPPAPSAAGTGKANQIESKVTSSTLKPQERTLHTRPVVKHATAAWQPDARKDTPPRPFARRAIADWQFWQELFKTQESLADCWLGGQEFPACVFGWRLCRRRARVLGRGSRTQFFNHAPTLTREVSVKSVTWWGL